MPRRRSSGKTFGRVVEESAGSHARRSLAYGPGDEALPAEFVARIGGVLGDELPVFLAALGAPEEGLRVNTLRLSEEEFASISPFPLAPLLGVPEGFILSEAKDLRGGPEEGTRAPGKHAYHAAGLYYLQDPGAMLVGALVEAQPGELVLDIAAAPGGKATHLAARMRGEGVLVANDVSRSRAQELVGNLERLGVGNAIVTSESPDRLARHFGPYFDRVLVDAPCSGESMFHKSRAARTDWSLAAVEGCARRQLDLLRTAVDLVRPGGLLIYSTCTFSREENEEVVSRLVAEHSDLEPSPLAPVESADAVSIGRGSSDTAAAYRLWPHRVPGAGHFIATLRRGKGGTVSERPPRREQVDEDAMKLCRAFVQDVFPNTAIDEERISLAGDEMRLDPQGAPSTRGLRILRRGLPLGTIKRGRFEPAHALAMAAPRPIASREVNLDREDPRVRLYLTGHPISSGGQHGWVPVTVDGFALGWGKRVGGTVKNHLPKGLRWRG